MAAQVRTRDGSDSCTANMASLPATVSSGDWKYVGDVAPHRPSIEPTCQVTPIWLPATKRAAFSSRQLERPHPSW
jgi:hypothetical protein